MTAAASVGLEAPKRRCAIDRLRINLTSAGVVAPEFESADDRGAAPNRGRAKPNLRQRALLRLPAAIQQGPGLPHQGLRRHSSRCRGSTISSFVSPRFSSQTILLRQGKRLASVVRLPDPKCLILLQCNRATCRLAKR